jgi:hypothetical protein
MNFYSRKKANCLTIPEEKPSDQEKQDPQKEENGLGKMAKIC